MTVDFHTHVFPSFFRETRSRFFPREPAFKTLYESPRSRLAGTEDLLRTMDEEGIEKSVIFGFPWEEADHYKRHNDYILESVGKHPARLVGFCCFSPLSPQGTREAQRCLAEGLAGVGELALYDSGFTADVRERLKDLMALCAGLDVPVLFHANEPVGHAYPGKTPMELSEVYRLVKQYPSNRIVLAHWGGGLFFYGLMKKEVGDALQQVWFDTAASPFLYKPDIYRVAADIIGPDKILLGSDYPLLTPKRYFQDMDAAGLSEEIAARISGENAARLLRL